MRAREDDESLRRDIDRLKADRDRYRHASDAALGQFEACIDFFAARPKLKGFTRALRANRDVIRRRLVRD